MITPSFFLPHASIRYPANSLIPYNLRLRPETTTSVPEEINHCFDESVSLTTSLENLSDQSKELILEQTADTPRKTALVYLAEGEALPTHTSGVELLILDGTCIYNSQSYGKGHYLRFPGPASVCASRDNCKLFVKYDQFMPDDKGERIIDTNTADKWLPGPAEGIRIRPLHVFHTESIMLLHWTHADEFRPNLDPQGEEILVINGLLQNRDHLFKAYSWIRNPIEDWRSWHGSTGTLAYYKSGHFPQRVSPDTASNR